MGIRAKTGSGRCSVCRLHFPICLCATRPQLHFDTEIVLFMHYIESFKTSNTGILLQSCLTHSQLNLFGGQGNQCLDWDALEFDARDCAVLFPSPEAQPLAESWFPKRLIVPDGNWRQASKMAKKLQRRFGIRAVSIQANKPSNYRFRKAPKEGWICTYEAAVASLECLYGKEAVAPLDDYFLRVMDRLAWMKGWLDREAVYGGIPAGLQRHQLVKSEASTGSPKIIT